MKRKKPVKNIIHTMTQVSNKVKAL